MNSISLLLVALLFCSEISVQSTNYQQEKTDISEARNFLEEGLLAKKKNDVNSALKLFFEAKRIFETENSLPDLCKVNEAIGDLYTDYYRHSEAIPYKIKTYQILVHLRDSAKIAKIANNIAWSYLKLGFIDSAFYYSAVSIDTYEKSSAKNNHLLYCISLETMGELLALKGNFNEANEILQKSKKIGIEQKNNMIVGFTTYGLALNEFLRKNYSKAKVHIESILPFAEKNADKYLLLDVYKLTYQIYDGLKSEKKTLDYLKKYSGLNDELKAEDVNRKAAIINANYEIQKRDADLKILSQVNSIQQLEIDRQSLIRNSMMVGFGFASVIVFLLVSRFRNKKKLESIEHERKTKELDQARKFQLALLPKKPINNELIEIWGEMRTASEVGGDYYDFIKIDDDRICVAVGDATGHGMTAGVIVSMVKVSLLSNLKIYAQDENLDLLMKSINETLKLSLSTKGIGMALTLAVINSKSGSYKLSSNGMPFPFYFNSAENDLKTIEFKNPPLGFFQTIPVTVHHGVLKKDDSLVILSDGFSERFNGEKAEFGDQRIFESLKANLIRNNAVSKITNHLFEETDLFANSIPNHDDMTILIVKMKSQLQAESFR